MLPPALLLELLHPVLLIIQNGRCKWHRARHAFATAFVSKSNQYQTIRANAKLLAEQVSALSARGSHVYLYEMPFPEKIARSHFVTLTRAAAHEAIPDRGLWLQLSYPIDQLRFTDHAHLDERSALLVARSIAQAIDKRLPSRTDSSAN
jgi:hypothetical protein